MLVRKSRSAWWGRSPDIATVQRGYYCGRTTAGASAECINGLNEFAVPEPNTRHRQRKYSTETIQAFRNMRVGRSHRRNDASSQEYKLRRGSPCWFSAFFSQSEVENRAAGSGLRERKKRPPSRPPCTLLSERHTQRPPTLPIPCGLVLQKGS